MQALLSSSITLLVKQASAFWTMHLRSLPKNTAVVFLPRESAFELRGYRKKKNNNSGPCKNQVLSQESQKCFSVINR